MIRRELVDRSVRDGLAASTGKEIGLAEAPSDLTLPYAILYPIASPGGDDRTWGDLEEWRDYNYQVTSVGSDHRQTVWMADRVGAFFVGKLPGGDYTFPISPAGLDVNWRMSIDLGTPEPSGQNLFQVADRYRIRLHKPVAA